MLDQMRMGLYQQVIEKRDESGAVCLQVKIKPPANVELTEGYSSGCSLLLYLLLPPSR